MSSRASDRCGSPPKFSQQGVSTTGVGLWGFGFGRGVGGGGGGGCACVTVTPVGCVSSLPPGCSGRRISHADASPAASRARTATTTMINVRLRGRRGNRGQCARGLRYVLPATVAAAAVLVSAATAGGPVTTDEPGSIVAAFTPRSYAP